MVNLLKYSARGAGILLATGLLVAAPGGVPGGPGTVTAPQQRFAQPGTVNYAEGQVRVDGQSIAPGNIGSTMVAAGHLLETGNGKAEMLLTPGVFLRLGPQSSVRMVSPSLSDTRVQLVQGQAMMEVADFQKENHIQVAVDNANTAVKSAGIYEFTTNPPMARVYDGKVAVEANGRTRNLEKGGQVALDNTNAKLKSGGFDLKRTETSDDLYAWSKLRADYTAQANMSAAETYAGYAPGAYGPGWYGAGWYWNPYFNSYAFLLGDGFLWDPFGFGFFSPWYWGMYGPYLGHGYGFGHGYAGVYGRPGGAITRNSAAGAALRAGVGGFHGAAAAGGFHSGGFAGGGFGGGGFGGGGGRR